MSLGFKYFKVKRKIIYSKICIFVSKCVAYLMLINAKRKNKAAGEVRMGHKERAPLLGREVCENFSEWVDLTTFPPLCTVTGNMEQWKSCQVVIMTCEICYISHTKQAGIMGCLQ